MKTFEEEFPSLKGCEGSFNLTDEQKEKYSGWHKFVFTGDIQKHCLDKARVNKVLWNNLKNVKGMVYETILEELGLE